MADLRARRHHREQALRAFTRAAAALTEPGDATHLAFAFLEGALGLVELAKGFV